jgi:hypothetical protein
MSRMRSLWEFHVQLMRTWTCGMRMIFAPGFRASRAGNSPVPTVAHRELGCYAIRVQQRSGSR